MNRDDVDAERIGFIGHSYGGRMALWLPAFDRRIKASVSNCCCLSYKDSLPRNIGIQMEFCIPGIMEKYEVKDIVNLIQNCPLLISATDDDVWSLGAQELYDAVKPTLGDNVALKTWSGKHVFTPEMRQYAYGFLDEKLR
jgi:dienelactone hydrolase